MFSPTQLPTRAVYSSMPFLTEILEPIGRNATELEQLPTLMHTAQDSVTPLEHLLSSLPLAPDRARKPCAGSAPLPYSAYERAAAAAAAGVVATRSAPCERTGAGGGGEVGLDTSSSERNALFRYECDDASEYLHDLTLTSFVPDHHEHVLHDPLQVLVDPDQPPSYPASTSTSMVGSIMAASQRGGGNVIMFPSMSVRSSFSDVSQPAGGAGGFDSGGGRWSGSASGWDSASRGGAGASGAGAGQPPWVLRGWAGLLPPRPGPPIEMTSPPASAFGGGYTDPPPSASGSGESRHSPNQADTATTNTRSDGDAAQQAQAPRSSDDAGGAAAGTSTAPAGRSDARGGRQQRDLAVSGSGGSNGPPPMSTDFWYLMRSSWQGFADPVLESDFRLYWTTSCWLVDAAVLLLTVSLLTMHAVSESAGQTQAMLLLIVSLPLLLSGLMLLAVNSQVSTIHRA